jgi:hypothetical protein
MVTNKQRLIRSISPLKNVFTSRTFRYFIPAAAVSLVLLSMLLSGCDKNPTEIALKYDYSLYAYLKVGETINADNPVTIKLLLDPYKPFNEQDLGVENAVVNLYLEDSDDLQYTLVHHSNGKYIALADAELIIEPAKKYSIEIDIEGHRITASTLTPALTEFSNNVMSSDSLDTTPATIDSLRANPLKISCPLGESRIVYIETYCLEEYSNARYIYPFWGNDYPADQEAYENPANGSPRRLSAIGIYSSKESIDAENIHITDYDALFFFYGKNRLSVYAVDENYYKSIYNTNGWESGGVTGAYGVFASGMGATFYTTIIE